MILEFKNNTKYSNQKKMSKFLKLVVIYQELNAKNEGKEHDFDY